MKKYFVMYVILSLIVLAGFLIAVTTYNNQIPPAVNTVEVNEIIQQVSANWGNIEGLSTARFEYRFFVMNNYGDILYTTNENLPETMHTAIALGFLPMNIFVDSQLVGMGFIETSYRADGSQMGGNIMIFTFLLVCVLNAVFLAVIYVIMIRPFKTIQQFAHKISLGILDDSLPINKNNLFGLFTQSFDIMRESLKDARQKQHNAERAHKELIASLSHDIKTPVTSIKIISELLQVKSTDPATTEKLQTIETKANEITRLMNDMLHSTLESLGELSVNPASENSGILQVLFKNADHLSKIRQSPIPSCLIAIDPVRMEQVIGNIIINAYKYADTEIDVNFEIVNKGLQIDINDYGKGVDPEELELIITKFYRGQNTKAKEGEGLGLYVAKQLMEKMGGGMEAFNRKDGFTIRLWVRLG
ncbi:MAG: ATP-binding protein [Defluviitaleaceae bacterium]|nr:ATP-binding protein [Defluviitaleaceae bacterium]